MIINSKPWADSQVMSRTSLGPRVAWIFCILTCLQMAFLIPYVVLVSGERANLFSAVLAAVSLILALIWGRRSVISKPGPAVWFSLILLGLGLISAILSQTPSSSLARTFTLAASGLGGFWCARLLIDTPQRRATFLWLCFAILTAVLVLEISAVIKTGQIYPYLDSHWHPVGSRLLLLSMAPLAMLSSSDRRLHYLGTGWLILAYVGLILAGKYNSMESVVMIPAGLVLVAACCGPWRSKLMVILIALILVLSVIMGRILVQNKINLTKGHQSVGYRVENVHFSWTIARDNPFFGIGLWAPRDAYLVDYQTVYPHLTKENFGQWTRELRTSENTLLTFIADLGFPFVILYAGVLLFFIWRLVTMTFHPSEEGSWPPLALLLPIMGALVHFQVYEGLMQPHICWYFHLLIGLVPASTVKGHSLTAVKAVLGRGLVFGLVLALGTYLGTSIS